jgi:hypothetical protein
MGESDDRFFELAVNRLETSTDFRNLVFQGIKLSGETFH